MLRRLRAWLFDVEAPEQLPERVREAIHEQQERSEILIGWAELVLVALLALVYETTTMAGGVNGSRAGGRSLPVRFPSTARSRRIRKIATKPMRMMS